MPFGHIRNPVKKLMAIRDPNDQIYFSDTELSGHDPVVNEVLRMCLVRNPSKRASIEDLLEHKYLTINSTLTTESKLPRNRTPEGVQHKQTSMDKLLREYSNFSPGSKEAFFKHIQNK